MKERRANVCKGHEWVVTTIKSWTFVGKIFGTLSLAFLLTLIGIATYTYIDLNHFKETALRQQTTTQVQITKLDGRINLVSQEVKENGRTLTRIEQALRNQKAFAEAPVESSILIMEN